MRAVVVCVALVTTLICAGVPGANADDKAGSLEGVWVASVVEVDGNAMPRETAEKVRFTFKGDKVLIRGDSNAGKEVECTYKLDPKKDPKSIDIVTPEGGATTILGIYEIKGDELKVCFRHAKSEEGRPKKFETTPESELTFVVFKRQKR